MAPFFSHVSTSIHIPTFQKQIVCNHSLQLATTRCSATTSCNEQLLGTTWQPLVSISNYSRQELLKLVIVLSSRPGKKEDIIGFLYARAI